MKYAQPTSETDLAIFVFLRLLEKATEKGWMIDRMEVMPDHIHIFIKVKPTDSPHHIVSQLKSYRSFKLRAEFAWLKARLPTLWTRSYYCKSVGHIPEDAIKRYIEDQKQAKKP